MSAADAHLEGFVSACVIYDLEGDGAPLDGVVEAVVIFQFVEAFHFDVVGGKGEDEGILLGGVEIPFDVAVPGGDLPAVVRFAEEEMDVGAGIVAVLVLNPRVDVYAVDICILPDGLFAGRESADVTVVADDVAVAGVDCYFRSHVGKVGHADVSDAAFFAYVEEGVFVAFEVAAVSDIDVGIA